MVPDEFLGLVSHTNWCLGERTGAQTGGCKVAESQRGSKYRKLPKLHIYFRKIWMQVSVVCLVSFVNDVLISSPPQNAVHSLVPLAADS